jgi:hypothetical protein
MRLHWANHQALEYDELEYDELEYDEEEKGKGILERCKNKGGDF